MSSRAKLRWKLCVLLSQKNIITEKLKESTENYELTGDLTILNQIRQYQKLLHNVKSKIYVLKHKIDPPQKIYSKSLSCESIFDFSSTSLPRNFENQSSLSQPSPESLSPLFSITDDQKFPVTALLEQYSELKYENQLQPWSLKHGEYVAQLKEEKGLPYVKTVVKLQERINEFIHTEKSHLKKLRTLASVYYPILREMVEGGEDKFNERVPSVTKLISLHSSLIEILKDREDSSENEISQIGDVIEKWTSDADFFSIFKENSIDFCVKQKSAADYIANEVSKNSELAKEMKNREHSSLCNRLSCADFLACQFQRLTKYPLLVDSILKATDAEKNPEEAESLKNVLTVFKDLLMQVNQRIKTYQDKEKLDMVADQLDTSSLLKFGDMKEYAEIDFRTDKTLLHYGPAKFQISGDDNKELQKVKKN